MCDRDESWANLNTYQTCLNYRGKMRYKNYSGKEKKKLETVHSIHYRKCLCKQHTQSWELLGQGQFHLPQSIAEMGLGCLSSTEKRSKVSLGLEAKQFVLHLPNVNKNHKCRNTSICTCSSS